MKRLLLCILVATALLGGTITPELAEHPGAIAADRAGPSDHPDAGTGRLVSK